MKICTITCHDVYNHGASLQAYALQKYLIDSGHEVKIINYKPDYLSNHYNLFSIDNPKWEKNIFLKSLYLILKFPYRLKGLKRKNAFDEFTSKYLRLTKNQYTSNTELKENLPQADVYFCGSDQIWNSLHKNGKDPAFYLEFVPGNKIKASYAASFAIDSISEELADIVRKRVERLDAVSVREKSGVSILKELNIKNSVNVVDPVFLLNKLTWDKIGNRVIDEEYILIYDFDNSNLIKKLAEEIKRKTGYKIFSVNPIKLKYVDKAFSFDGPETFISLIKHSKFVISNSYHAAVFSIIYEKNFVIVNREESINTRMRDLLDDLNLRERLINYSYDIHQVIKDIDFKECKSILNEKISFSKHYINKVLSMKQ
ncbi:polysaccharide pyruvyl transferase family protein [Mesobacillus foraminis]|uniref:polysaccharide pyruvyl transferase family protein n=1 Tax=Mesobacillus foraminis TaxID=279826 RepID=UPI001BEC8FFC|nr:polysaccharide pyruvyl transferase family protein [Mesobacillus foraminis]MBT2758408.1 polysaccharide pyruvyl transferase family protein [Mesobacillus foraminis]